MIYVIFTNLFCHISFLDVKVGNSEGMVLFCLGSWYQKPLINNGKLFPFLN